MKISEDILNALTVTYAKFNPSSVATVALCSTSEQNCSGKFSPLTAFTSHGYAFLGLLAQLTLSDFKPQVVRPNI